MIKPSFFCNALSAKAISAVAVETCLSEGEELECSHFENSLLFKKCFGTGSCFN